MASYLAVRNWERYQHYKDGRPLVWVKFHVSLLDDQELRALPPEVRLLWDQLLLVAGRTDNCIPHDTKWIAECTSLDNEVTTRGTKMLLKGRWLSHFRSRRALELARARERSRREEKRREESPTPYKRKSTTPAERVEALIRNGVIRDEVDLEAETTAAHLNSELVDRLREMLRPM